MENTAIDFVVTWVDDSDPVWRAKKAEHTGVGETEGNTNVRYRDWDTLKYWFRGVEKFAPWVRYVFFVTDDQKPEWLNVDHPKLKWVKHTDFIPSEYLPTFSSNAIEWNLHRIKELSENFVYFNDDMFLIRDTKPTDFFVNGLPCDFPNIGILYASGFFSYMLFNNMEISNRHFSFKEAVKKNFSKWTSRQSLGGFIKLALYGRKMQVPAINSWHLHISYKKQVFETIWKKEFEIIDATCRNKLRTKNDVTSWLARDWQLLSGEFYSKKPIGAFFHTSEMNDNNMAISYLQGQKVKAICLNDNEKEDDFENHKRMILNAFEQILPDKSSFEI